MQYIQQLCQVNTVCVRMCVYVCVCVCTYVSPDMIFCTQGGQLCMSRVWETQRARGCVWSCMREIERQRARDGVCSPVLERQREWERESMCVCVCVCGVCVTLTTSQGSVVMCAWEKEHDRERQREKQKARDSQFRAPWRWEGCPPQGMRER